jgi:hypothetical protein
MDQGGKIRSANILKGMLGGAFHITLVSPAPADITSYRPDIATICDTFISWPEAKISRIARILSLISRYPVSVAGDRSRTGQAIVRQQLTLNPDIVVVDFPHADVLLPRQRNFPSVLFTHNVETEIFQRHASRSRGIMRWIWADQRRKMDRFEKKIEQILMSDIAINKDIEVIKSDIDNHESRITNLEQK